MNDISRIRDVTANYFFWQGLRWVPLGFAILLLGVDTAGPEWWPFGELAETIFFLALVLVILALQAPIGAYYRRTFGEVRARPGMHQRRERVKWFVVTPAIFAAILVDALLEPPLFLSGPVFGAAVFAYWWSTGKGRRHYPVIAALLALLAALPPLGLVETGDPILSLFFLVVGTAYIVGGFLDHRELVGLLKRADPA